jgi:hypothetical protein
VPDQGGPGKETDTGGVKVARVLTLVGAVDRYRALDDVQGQEADDGGEQGQSNAEQLPGLLAERFRHQVEGDHTEHEPCSEPEDEVLVVAEPQGREPTGQRGDERSQRHQNRDHGTSVRFAFPPARRAGLARRTASAPRPHLAPAAQEIPRGRAYSPANDTGPGPFTSSKRRAQSAVLASKGEQRPCQATMSQEPTTFSPRACG